MTKVLIIASIFSGGLYFALDAFGRIAGAW